MDQMSRSKLYVMLVGPRSIASASAPFQFPFLLPWRLWIWNKKDLDLGLTINADNLFNTDMESDYANPKYIGWGGNRSEDPQEVMERIQVLKSVQVMMMMMMILMMTMISRTVLTQRPGSCGGSRRWGAMDTPLRSMNLSQVMMMIITMMKKMMMMNLCQGFIQMDSVAK